MCQSETSHSPVDISDWVERARTDPHAYRERQAIEVLLAAIGRNSPHGEKLYLKGGTLMGIVYRSPRQTADVDFTADFSPTEEEVRALMVELDQNLSREPARIGYPDLICRIQTVKRQPRQSEFEGANAPALSVTMAYAERDTRQHEQLKAARCATIVKIDISFREPVHAIELIQVGEGSSCTAYSTVDIIAEKLRALIQQTERKHPMNRRQDVYDIAYLIRMCTLGDEDKGEILTALREKSRARGIEPTVESLGDPEIKRRAGVGWDSMKLEVSGLPAFEDAYEEVEAFYRSLPWHLDTE